MKKLFILLPVLFGLTIAACHKDSTPSKSRFTISIKHNVDGASLSWNTIQYKNDAGNLYGIDRLQYYLSNFRFYRNAQLIIAADSVFYIDAHDSISQIVLPQVNVGAYDSIAFYIGVDEQKNISNYLPASLENIDMGWPDVMGGGYHFMKFEGHWKDSSGTPGFTMHLGMNGFQVLAGIGCKLNIKYNVSNELGMTMNINEWFRNPNKYNFSTDGVYIMGDTVLMKKISQNGADVFKADQ